jgi:hypothetical protein
MALAALALQTMAPSPQPAEAGPGALPTTMACRMITPTGAVLTFSAETRTAGARQQVRLVPASGTPWPKTVSAFVDSVGMLREARFDTGGHQGALVLSFLQESPDEPWWQVELSRPNERDGGPGLPVALGSCGEAGGPESGALLHPAVTAEGDFFDPAAWPSQCYVLARDGRTTRIQVLQGDAKSGGFNALDGGIWPQGVRTVRQIYAPDPPPRGNVGGQVNLWRPDAGDVTGSTTGWLMFLRDPADGAAAMIIDFWKLGGQGGNGSGFGICGFRKESSQEQAQ